MYIFISFLSSLVGGASDGGPPADEILGEQEIVVDNDNEIGQSGGNGEVRKLFSSVFVYSYDAGDLQECEPGEYAPVPGDCNAFTVCKDGFRYAKKCAAGLHFVREKNSCDWPQNSGCQDGSNEDHSRGQQVGGGRRNRPYGVF